MGTHNIQRGLLKSRPNVDAALRRCHILALQEADIAANFESKTHTPFPPAMPDGYDQDGYGQWLFVRKKSKIIMLSQDPLWIGTHVRGQVYTLESPLFAGKMLLVNLHLPTGIDRMPKDDPLLLMIETALTSALSTVADFDHAIVLGDINETSSLALDRTNPTHGGKGRVAAILEASGFIDAYRAVHCAGGHTRRDRSGHTSRLDQMWVRGTSLFIIDACVVRDHGIQSDHDRLEIVLNVPKTAYVSCSAMRAHNIPLSLFADDPSLKDTFATEVQDMLERSDFLPRFLNRSFSTRNAAWRDLCHRLVTIAMDVSRQKMRPTGGCVEVTVINRAIDTFSNLPGKALFLSNIGRHCYSDDHMSIISKLQPRLKPPLHVRVGGTLWMEWMNKLVAARGKHNVLRKRKLNKNTLFSALRGRTAMQIDSAVDTDPDTGSSRVTFDPTRVKEIMRRTYLDLVGIAPNFHGDRPVAVERTLAFGRALSQREPFKDLFDTDPARLRNEVLRTLRKVNDIIGVGTDGVPDSLFKWSVMRAKDSIMLDILTAVVTQNFEETFFYESAKEGSMKIIPKPNRAGSSGGRGITKGNLAGKLPSAILAARLNRTIVRHDLLARGVENAYLLGKGAHEAIRKWLQTWKLALELDMPCFNIFYDLVKAFDKISWNMIIDGIVSIGGSDALVRHVRSFLANNRTRVETSFGPTDWITLVRGIKQGDPLSALLFLIAMNIIHLSVDLAAKDPCTVLTPFVLHGAAYSTAGFSDDIRLVQMSRTSVLAANSLINEICRHYGVEMNPTKVHATGRSCTGGLPSCWSGSIPISSIVDGEYVTVEVPTQDPLVFAKYLGIEANMNLKSLVATRIESKIHHFGHLVVQNHIPAHLAAVACNSMLTSKIEYLCPYVCLRKLLLRRWDSLVTSAIAACLPCCGIPANAAVKTFFKLKVPSETIVVARIAQLHRILITDSPEGEAARDECNCPPRSRKWFAADFELARKRNVIFERNKLFGTFCQRSSPPPLRNVAYGGSPCQLSMSAPHLWGAGRNRGHTHIWTDGSYKKDEDGTITASWAVVLGTDAFYKNWESFHSCKNYLLRKQLLSKFDYISSAIKIPNPTAKSDGSSIVIDSSYKPELLALFAGYTVPPLTWDADVWTDSSSSMGAISNADHLLYDVRGLARKDFHPLLSLVCHADQARRGLDASFTLHHQRSHTGDRTVNATGIALADFAANEARIRGITSKFTALNTDYGDQRVTISFQNVRLTSDLRAALWGVYRKEHIAAWAKTSHWPFNGTDPTPDDTSCLSFLADDPYVSVNPLVLPLLIGILGDAGPFKGVEDGACTCTLCGLPMSGRHVAECLVYRSLHAMEVSRLFRIATQNLTFTPSSSPASTRWHELLLQAAFVTKSRYSILPDPDKGSKYYIQMIEGQDIHWAGYFSHSVLESLVLRYASTRGLAHRPKDSGADKHVLDSFGRHFLESLFILLHKYECRGTVSIFKRSGRCQRHDGMILVPHKSKCNTRYWWRAPQCIVNIAVDILGATIDLSANAVGLNRKFVSHQNVNVCDIPFGAVRAPLPQGSSLFAFLSRTGKPPSNAAIDLHLRKAKNAAHSRLILVLAVDDRVLTHLRSFPDLAVVASFPGGTLQLRPPAVWRFEKVKKPSSFPFVMCIWQARGFCTLHEASRKCIERRLFVLGVRAVHKRATTHVSELDRLWMNLSPTAPFSYPTTRAESLYLLSSKQKAYLRNFGIRGKALNRLLVSMRHGLIDFMIEKWLSCCPKKKAYIRRTNTLKNSKPKGRKDGGDDVF